MLPQRVLPPREYVLRLLDLGRRAQLREDERLGVGVVGHGERAHEDGELDLGRARALALAERALGRRAAAAAGERRLGDLVLQGDELEPPSDVPRVVAQGAVELEVLAPQPLGVRLAAGDAEPGEDVVVRLGHLDEVGGLDEPGDRAVVGAVLVLEPLELLGRRALALEPDEVGAVGAVGRDEEGVERRC